MLFCAVGLNEPLGNRFLFVFFLFSANTSSYFGIMNCGASGAATTLAGAVTAISSSGETVCVTALNPGPVMSLGTPSVPAAETAVTVTPQPFDVRLIPEYDGTADIVEWLQRTEFLCQLRGVSVMSVLPLRLNRGAFVVWSQLPDAVRNSLEAVRDALFAAFALDEHAAYEAFSARRLRPGEAADVFLADLRRLAALFGGMPERGLCCAFVAGLPEVVRQTLRTGSRAEGLDLASVLTRARALLSDERASATAAAAQRSQPAPIQRSQPAATRQPQDRRPRWPRCCWTCGEPGHIAAACPRRLGNDAGEVTPAPVSSPRQH